MKFLFILLTLMSLNASAARTEFDMNNPDKYLNAYEASLKLKSDAGVAGVVLYNLTGLTGYCGVEALAIVGQFAAQCTAAVHEASIALVNKETNSTDEGVKAKARLAEEKVKASYEKLTEIMSDQNSKSYRLVHSNVNCARKFHENKILLRELMERLSERQPEK